MNNLVIQLSLLEGLLGDKTLFVTHHRKVMGQSIRPFSITVPQVICHFEQTGKMGQGRVKQFQTMLLELPMNAWSWSAGNSPLAMPQMDGYARAQVWSFLAIESSAFA